MLSATRSSICRALPISSSSSNSSSVETTYISEQPSLFSAAGEKIGYGKDENDCHYLRLKTEIGKITQCSLSKRAKMAVAHIINQIQSKLITEKSFEIKEAKKAEFIDKLNSLNIPNFLSEIFLDEVFYFASYDNSFHLEGNTPNTQSISKILQATLPGDWEVIINIVQHDDLVISEIELCEEYKCHADKIKYYVDDINAKSGCGFTFLHIVICLADLKSLYNIILALSYRMSDEAINAKDWEGDNALLTAIRAERPIHDKAIFELIISIMSDENLHAQGHQARTALDEAIVRGRLEIVKLIISRMSNKDKNAQKRLDRLFLKAIDKGHIKIAELIISRMLENKKAQYAGSVEAGIDRNDYTEIAELLNHIVFNKSEEAQACLGTALLKAISKKSTKIVELLLLRMFSKSKETQQFLKIALLRVSEWKDNIGLVNLIVSKTPTEVLQKFISETRLYKRDCEAGFIHFIDKTLHILGKVEKIQSKVNHPLSNDNLLDAGIRASEKEMPHVLVNMIHSYDEINNLQHALRHLKFRGIITDRHLSIDNLDKIINLLEK